MQNTNIQMTDGGLSPIPSPAEKIRDISRKPKYSKKTWESATADGKIKLLNDYLNEVADAMKIGICPEIKFFDEASDVVGRYNRYDNCVEINKSRMNSYDRYKTIRHELRHAYQAAASYGIDVYGYDCPYPESEETRKAWYDNYLCYYGPKYGDLYKDQPIEKDAYSWADSTGY